MNKKVLTSLVAVLICISLISAGYSAWLIIKIEGVDGAEAQFKVHTVQTKELQFEAKVLAESGKTQPITLGKPANSKVAFKYATVDGEEDLEFELQITLKPLGKEWSDWTKEAVTFKFSLTDFKAGSDTEGKYLTLPMGKDNKDNYVEITCNAKGECTVSKTGLNQNDTVEVEDGIVTIPLSLAWGSAFTVVSGDTSTTYNPYEYFNTQGYNSDADTGFKAKADALAAITEFSITVTGTWYGNSQSS